MKKTKSILAYCAVVLTLPFYLISILAWRTLFSGHQIVAFAPYPIVVLACVWFYRFSSNTLPTA
ncbi:hypothetical protein [Mucilaginibacter sp.]